MTKDDVTLHAAIPAGGGSMGYLKFEAKTPVGHLVLEEAYVLQDGSLEDAKWILDGEPLEGLDEYPSPDFRRKDWADKEKIRERLAEAVSEWIPYYREFMDLPPVVG